MSSIDSVKFVCPGCSLVVPMRPDEFPLHCRCGHVSESLEDSRVGKSAHKTQRTDAELDELIATFCEDCDHYTIAEVCSADPGCQQCREKSKWRARALHVSYQCPKRKWTAAPVVDHQDSLNDGRARLENTTICITTFQRPDSLRRLLDSLRNHYPKAVVEVEDTQGNLSAGRNRLVKRCKTKFALIMEDDFEATAESRLDTLAAVLNSDNEVGVVCGALYQKGQLSDHAKDIKVFRGVLEATTPPTSDWLEAENGVQYRYIDMGANFFLARHEVLEELPWDEDLELMEHAPWFWQLKQSGKWRVAYTDHARMMHYVDRPTEEYKRLRLRATSFSPIIEQKYGFRRVVVISKPKRTVLLEGLRSQFSTDETRPNIIVFGVGHQGSRLFVQMLHALGWQMNDVKQNVLESMGLQAINKEMLLERGICECGSIAKLDDSQWQCPRCKRAFPPRVQGSRVVPPAPYLAGLEQPWVIKDPRLVLTISDPRWREALAKVRPVLLFHERDLSRVRRTYKKNKLEAGIFGHTIEELRQIARMEYDRWPWAKLMIHYEDLINSARCVDFTKAE